MLGEIVDSPETWAILLMLCALVLFAEAAGTFQALLATRQARWRFFLVLIPLAASIWSFTNGAQALGLLENTSHPVDIHLTASLYLALKEQLKTATENYQIQVGIAGGAFIFSLLLEKVFHMPYVSFLQHTEKAA